MKGYRLYMSISLYSSPPRGSPGPSSGEGGGLQQAQFSIVDPSRAINMRNEARRAREQEARTRAKAGARNDARADDEIVRYVQQEGRKWGFSRIGSCSRVGGGFVVRPGLVLLLSSDCTTYCSHMSILFLLYHTRIGAV